MFSTLVAAPFVASSIEFLGVMASTLVAMASNLVASGS